MLKAVKTSGSLSGKNLIPAHKLGRTSQNAQWYDMGTDTPADVIDYYSMQGCTTPGYFALSRKGVLLPFTPFDKYVVKGSSHGAFHWIRLSDGYEEQIVSGNLSVRGWIISPTELQVYMADKVVNERALLQEAAANAVSGFDVLTFAAEAHKLNSMFRNAVPRILKNLRSPKNWPSLWLEYRYGWRTFGYDMRELHEAVNRLHEHPNLLRLKGRQSEMIDSSSTSVITTPPNWDGFTFTEQVATSKTLSTRAHVIGDFKTSAFTSGFRVNPLVTAWELLPYSFVLDWFIGVGRALDALTFRTLSSNYAAGFGVKAEITRTLDFAGSPRPGHSGVARQTATCTASLTRRWPSTVDMTPHTNADWFSLPRLADGLSLLVGLFKRAEKSRKR